MRDITRERIDDLKKYNENTTSDCNKPFVYVLAVSKRTGGSIAERV